MICKWLCILGTAACISLTPVEAEEWLGGVNSDWNNAANWDPASVPTSTAIVNANSGAMPVISNFIADVDSVTLGFDQDSGANTRLTIRSGGALFADSGTIGRTPGAHGTLLISRRGIAEIGNLGVGSIGLGTGQVILEGGSLRVDSMLVGPDSSVVVDGGNLQGDGALFVFDGKVEIGRRSHLLFDDIQINGGELSLKGGDSNLREVQTLSLSFGRMDLADRAFASSKMVYLFSSSLSLRGDGTALRTRDLFANGSSDVLLDSRGAIYVKYVSLLDETEFLIRGKALLVASKDVFAANRSKFTLEAKGVAILKDFSSLGLTQVRDEGSKLFARSIGLGKSGDLLVEEGGSVSAGPISGGTIVVNGSENARGSVASTEFADNELVFSGGQISALQSNEKFIHGSRPIVLKPGGGYFNSDRFNVEVQSQIVGVGALHKVGDGALILNRRQEYTGGTHVHEGKLFLRDGSLQGPVEVDENAFFGGTGRINGNVHSFGKIGPGFSPGSIRIAGKLTLESTSTVRLEIASKDSYDRIRIDGAARLDGRLHLALLGGFSPNPGEEFTLLTAGKIKGDFEVVSSDFDAAVVGNKVIVAWNGGREEYEHYARTGNQLSAAGALQQLREKDFASNSDFNRNVRPVLDALSPSGLRLAFDAVAPSQSVSFSSVAFARSKSWMPQMANRMELARSRPMESGITTLGAADMKNVVVQTPERLGVWLDGSGVFTNTASFDGLRTGDASAASGTVGVDYKLSETFAVGAYTGYIGSWTDFGGGTGVDSNGTRFGVYSTWQSGGFYLNSVVGGEWNAYDWNRHIVFPGIDRRASADTTGTVFETSFGGGYDWNITDRLKLGVFSGLEYTLLNVSGFTESGAGALDLDIDDQDADSLRTNLGVQGAWSIPVNTRILRPTLAAAWRHEYLDGSRGVGSQLVAGGGPGFNTNIPGSDRKDSLLLNAGFSMELTDEVTGYLYYTGDIAGSTDDVHSVNAGLRLQF